VRLSADAPSSEHSLDREEVFVVLAGRLTARFADREESTEAGGALIVPAGERFSLVAAGGPAEAVCVLPVGARATMGGEVFTPPWAT
jgi:mannose-6-phosphate isomerase-like protein (cupin superfamily)